jgi:glycosyltransferase involved in cell wall biosynthesis
MTDTVPLPRIGVVVPSFNQGRFLRAALESIFRQDYPNLEVVVMDGGSTDESVAIIQSYAGRLRHWRSSPDGGQSAAINEGVQYCTGELVTWLNSDDFYHGDSLWEVARAYQAHPNCGLYIGNGFRYDERTGRWSPFCTRHVALCREALTHGPDYLLQPATFVLRRAWEEVGGLDPALRWTMDWDIYQRVAARYSAVLLNEFLAVSREYDETKTCSGKMERVFEIIRVARRHTGREVTAGGLLFLFETLLDVMGPLAIEQLGAHARSSLQVTARHISMRWGGGHGYPEQSDPQDHIYLPLARRDAAGLPPTEHAPSVTLLVPCGDDWPLVPATVESALAQSYARLNLVVIDNCSGGVRAELFLGALPPCVTRVPAAGANLAAALNCGLRVASGEFVGWLRPGDRLAAGALAAAARAATSAPEASVVYGNTVFIDAAGRFVTPLMGHWRTGFHIASPPRLGLGLPPDAPFALPEAGVLFRRDLLDALGPLNERIRDEFATYEFFCRVFRAGTSRKIERTQVLTLARELDTVTWWRAWYRALRRSWPRPWSRGFVAAVRGYVTDLLRRRFPSGPRRASRWVAGAAILKALTGLGNPERWPRHQAFPPRPAESAAAARRGAELQSLVCLIRLPRAPGRSGAETREYQILSALHSLSNIHAVVNEPVHGNRRLARVAEVDHPGCLSETCPLPALPRPRRGRLSTRLAAVLRRRGWPVRGGRFPLAVTEQFRAVDRFSHAVVAATLRHRSPDLLIVGPQVNPLALTLRRSAAAPPLVLIAHALDSEAAWARAKGARGVAGWALRWEARRAAGYERWNYSCYDGVIAASPEDRDRLIRLYDYPAERIFVFPKGADPEHWEGVERRPESGTVAFVGSLRAATNRDAAERLARRIFPLIRRRHPVSKLLVINPDRRVPFSWNPPGDGVEIIHTPEDVRAALARAAVVCMPLPPGSAVEGFALEVLAAGVPLVTTADGAEGLGLSAGTQYLAGEDDAVLADAVCRILEDPDVARDLSRAGREVARSRMNEPPEGFGRWLNWLKQAPPRGMAAAARQGCAA